MQHWQGEELARGWGYRLPAWGEHWSRKVIDNFGDNGFQTTTGQLYKELLCHTKVKQGGMPGVLVESHTKQSQMHCLWVHTWFTIMIRSYTGEWVGAKNLRFPFLPAVVHIDTIIIIIDLAFSWDGEKVYKNTITPRAWARAKVISLSICCCYPHKIAKSQYLGLLASGHHYYDVKTGRIFASKCYK